MAIEVFRRYGTQGLILLNHNIHSRVEDQDIKRFKEAVAEYIGVPITYANMEGWDTKDQFDVVVAEGAFKVGSGTALCTNRLKTRPFEKWLQENVPDNDATIYYGFDASEPGRIQRRTAHLAALGFTSDYPLALWAERTIHSTTEVGIEPPRSYSKFKHANCVGCLKAGRQHWYVVYCLRPDIWQRAKWAEEEIGYTIIKGVSLVDLEPLFSRMKCVGVSADEKLHPLTFWASVRRAGISLDPDADAKPCECAA